MSAQSSARWGALVIAVVAGTCVTLTGCGGGSSASSPSTPASAGPSVPAADTPGNAVKLTGNFCTDVKNIGTNIRVPANATGSLSAVRQHGVPYLNQAAAYFNALATEAPAQAGKWLRILAADYQAMAGSIASGNVSSLPKIEQQMVSILTKGAGATALRQLLAYMVTKCASAGGG